MQGISMAQPCCVETLTVIIYSTGPIYDLIFAVAIDITNTEIVVSLASERLVTRRAIVTIEGPNTVELSVSPVPGSQHRPRIVPTSSHQAGPLTVQICNTCEKPIDAITVAIPPNSTQLFTCRIELCGMARRYVIGRSEFSAGPPVKDCEIFWSGENVSCGIVLSFSALTVASNGYRIGRFAGNLGSAITVQVVHHELCVVRSFANIFSQVNGP